MVRMRMGDNNPLEMAHPFLFKLGHNSLPVVYIARINHGVLITHLDEDSITLAYIQHPNEQLTLSFLISVLVFLARRLVYRLP